MLAALRPGQRDFVRRCRQAAPAAAGSVHGAPSVSAACVRFFCDGETPIHHARYPPRYFDFKAFREALKEKKDVVSEAEIREIRREFALPAPEGWTVLEFLKRMGFGEESEAEEVANLFERWEDFISMTPKDITRIPDITIGQRRKLDKHITMFNHGLWPKVSAEVYNERFQGKPLAFEGTPWSEADVRQLKKLAKEYDVNFGDPWIYISWEMQRREEDVKDKYVEVMVAPEEQRTTHELAITKASRPLHMHRSFRMIPPDLYVVPSEKNFTLAPHQFRCPEKFTKYRQDALF